MKSRLILALIAIAVVPLLAQKKTKTNTPSEVEITSEPSHHLVLENSYVRAFQVEAAPHSATLMHRHRHDYVFVTLGESDVSNEVEGQPPVTLKLQDGETRFTPGNFAHIVRNLADTPFRNVTIELLQDEKARSSPPPRWDEERGLHVLHGGTKEILFVKDGVRVSEVELQIAGVLPRHHHAGPELVVAITDLLFRSDVVGKGASNIEMKAGDVQWEEGGFTHTITNVGRQGAKLVILEFK
jgi:quercetin dioxygenase-like cupin family protein